MFTNKLNPNRGREENVHTNKRKKKTKNKNKKKNIIFPQVLLTQSADLKVKQN